ncbi:MAG: hypothetical protein EAZ16_11805 [Sphingobacteriales bacterium]|nr:MAG: hypothetical protein EAZ16_11805 [Sphingobacteriales bacterium]
MGLSSTNTQQKYNTKLIAMKASKQRIISVLIPCILGWALSFLATNIYRNYSLGLFVWLPFVMGATSTLILSYNNSVQRKALRNNAYFTLFVFSCGLLFFAWEGLICLLMAFPIGLLFTYLGFLAGQLLTKNKISAKTPTIIILLSSSVPALMSKCN